MKKNLGRKSKTPTPILTPTPPPFLTPTSAPKSSQRSQMPRRMGELTTKMKKKDAIAAISDSSGSNNSVDEPSDDVVDVDSISSATSFAESTSSSAGNISPVVSSFGVDFVDTLIEEEDATSSSSSAATITRNPSPIMPNEEQQQQHKSNLAATAATTSTSEDEIIGDVSMMDHDDDDVDNLVAAKVITTTASIHSSGDMPVYVSKAATTTTTTTTAATTTTTSSSSSGSSSSNSNNNNTTTQATTKSMFKKEANAKSFKDLENFFNEQMCKKIPTLFLPRVEKIQPLLDRLNSIEGVANKYTTKCIQNGAIRLHCKDMDTYTIISAELQKDNMELHTHQLRKNHWLSAIVIRHLHSTTDNQWIRDQLIAQGFQPIFIRVIKHRYSGKPMNMLEVELQPTTDGTNERILKLERLGSQDVIVEKQLKRIDPRGQQLWQQHQQQQKHQPNTPKQQQQHQQQHSAKKQQQQQQQKQLKQKPIQQQQNTLVKGNNNSNSKSKGTAKQPTYSQITKSGNARRKVIIAASCIWTSQPPFKPVSGEATPSSRYRCSSSSQISASKLANNNSNIIINNNNVMNILEQRFIKTLKRIASMGQRMDALFHPGAP
ncbi:hypothetical protein ACLKA6_017311 [Drosophila palustris]